MSAASRLRALDDRVIGRPRPMTPQRYALQYLIGVGGILAVLGLTVLSGRTGLFPAVGGFVGVLVGTAVRWARAADPRPQRRRAVLAGGLLVVLVAGAAATATRDRWADDRLDGLPDGFRTPEPTQVVLCAETPRGRAYTYQPPASEVPRCENGATPNVVLRP